MCEAWFHENTRVCVCECMRKCITVWCESLGCGVRDWDDSSSAQGMLVEVEVWYNVSVRVLLNNYVCM